MFFNKTVLNSNYKKEQIPMRVNCKDFRKHNNNKIVDQIGHKHRVN